MKVVKGGVFVAVVATALALAALAYAGNVRQTAGSVEIAPATSGIAKAKCGKLTRLGKGKVTLVGTGFSGAGISTFNQGLQPLRRKVVVTARNAGATSAKAKAFGYCAKRIPTTIRRQRSPLTPAAVHNVFVNCGKGETALAGGWKVLGTPPASWSVVNSLRQGRSTWVVSVASSGVGTVRAYAICTQKKLPLVARAGQKIPPTPGNISTAIGQVPAGDGRDVGRLLGQLRRGHTRREPARPGLLTAYRRAHLDGRRRLDDGGPEQQLRQGARVLPAAAGRLSGRSADVVGVAGGA